MRGDEHRSPGVVLPFKRTAAVMGDDGWAAADGVLDLKLEFDKKRTHAENVRRTRSATFLDDTQPTDADTLAPGSRWVAYNASQQRKNIQVISHDATNSRVYIHYLDADKRLDEWIPVQNIIEPLIEEPESKSASEKKYTRTFKRKLLETNNTLAYLAELDSHQAQFERVRDEVTKMKNINNVHFGKFLLGCWYFSPYPDAYGKGPIDTLHICHLCFKYMLTDVTLQRHTGKECSRRKNGPPGTRIYSLDNYAVFEVDGAVEKLFCQNLCLFAKLFLDHKTLYYNVQHFNFYLLYVYDDAEELPQFVGYFSKEKYSAYDFNLSCILTLPSYQRQGWGRFLIQFSYALTRLDGATGSPEKPLSDLGTVSYRKYWCSELLRVIALYPHNSSLKKLERVTGICHADVLQTLQSLGLLQYWKDEYVLDVENKNLRALQTKYHVDADREKIVDVSLIKRPATLADRPPSNDATVSSSTRSRSNGKGPFSNDGKTALRLRIPGKASGRGKSLYLIRKQVSSVKKQSLGRK